MAVPTAIADLSTTPASNSPAGSEAVGTNLDDYLRTAFAFIKQINDLTGAPRVLGLVGNVNSVTPLTKYDLSATSVILRNSSGGVIARHNTGTLTCDLGLAGSAANGRDQSAAFSANSWIYLYFISNGATLATLASTTAPASFTGSTLPSGYTHWAFATAVRWNASSNIVKVRALGRAVWYELDIGGANRALASGTATTFTTLNLAGIVPPVALMAVLSCVISGTSNAPIAIELNIRPTGSGLTSGMLVVGLVSQVASVACEAVSEKLFPLGTSTQIDYKLSNAPNVAGGAYIDVAAYIVPNGDA